MRTHNSGRRSKVVALLRFGKDIGDIVALIAPRIQVHRRIENAERRMQYQPVARNSLRNPKTRREIMSIWILQAFGESVLTTNKRRRSPAVESQIRIRKSDVYQRIHVLVAESHLNRGGVSELKAVLHKPIRIPLPKLHLGDAGLALLHRRQAEQEAGQS